MLSLPSLYSSLRLSKGHKNTSLKAPDGPFQSLLYAFIVLKCCVSPSQEPILSLIGLSPRLLLQSHFIPLVVLTKSFQLIRFSLRLSKGHKKTSLKAPDEPFQSRRLFKHYVLVLSFYSPYVLRSSKPSANVFFDRPESWVGNHRSRDHIRTISTKKAV